MEQAILLGRLYPPGRLAATAITLSRTAQLGGLIFLLHTHAVFLIGDLAGFNSSYLTKQNPSLPKKV
jgi:hypothetical protein